MNPFETPQEMVRTLAGMPLTILLAMFVADRLPMSETSVGFAAACTRRTARTHLTRLEGMGLIFKNKRVNGWDLTPKAKQLPIPFFLPMTTPIENGRLADVDKLTDGLAKGKNYPSVGKNYPSTQVIPSENAVIPEKDVVKGKNYPSATALAVEDGDLSASYIIDRQIDRQIKSKDMVYPPHPISVSMLRRMGISGDLEAMAWGMPSELIAAWWMCQWGKRPAAVLAKHLLDRRPIDPLYVKLAEWRMLASAAEVAGLIGLIEWEERPSVDVLPDGVSLFMYDVAAKVYDDMGYLPLWCD